MATLVLTAAGSLLGPVGGAVGALLGQAIDGRLFGPKGREGPRLQDLRVQTSSYGASIPKLFGTMRVAGTVIWSTDLVERRTRQGGGKGRPSNTSYSYSASFAVLLSGRPILSVGRIWADGNLLRGASGDWKSETAFRLHLGGEDQAVDPFIASAEGAEQTPAYRGCAYAVFENMALAPFGNRIPSLTFEVAADAAPVPVGTMLEELTNGVAAGEGTALHGFAASGESMRGLIEGLDATLALPLRDDGAMLKLVEADDAKTTLGSVEIGEDRSETLAGEGDFPAMLTIGYYDPARDFQAGLQSARRDGGRRVERLELPAALSAGEARGLAEAALARTVRERGSRSVRCGWARLDVAPGRLVRLPDDGGIWRVAGRMVDRDGVRLDLRRVGVVSAVARPAEPGRSVSPPDRPRGPTVVHVLDLPMLGDVLVSGPRVYIAAGGTLPGWRRASLLASLDGGVSWEPIGESTAPATLGTAESVLPFASEDLFDYANHIDIRFLHDVLTLEDATDARLLAGANLALLGDELVQFGRAEPLAGARWRLSRLLRGRRGTGWASASHAVGERFVMVEPDALLPYDPPMSATGATLSIMAFGLGDTVPVEASATAIGEALRPPAPAQFTARRRSDGGRDLSWVRSSRLGWSWLDGIDAPLGEDRELYRLTLTRADGLAKSFELGEAAFLYPRGDLVLDLAAGPVTASVSQIGTSAVSRPATLTLTA